MQSFKLLVRYILLVSTALLLSVSSAHAELIAEDDPVFGPDSLTVDTSTNLAWLDLEFTDREFSIPNYNYDIVSAQFGPGGDFEGFRYATDEEVLTFMSNAGIPDVPGSSVDNVGPITQFHTLVGTTDRDGTLSLGTTGTFTSSSMTSLRTVYAYLTGGNGEVATSSTSRGGLSNAASGSWLVKPAPPSSEVDADGDGFLASEDCNDGDASINPGAPEIFGNGVDDNCDGQIDEVVTAETVVYNNFAADGSFVGGSGYAVGGSGNFSAGMRFLPGQDGLLSSIEVGIRHNSGENTFTASIHLDQGGIPGTLLEMISVNGQAPPVKGIVSIAASGTTYLDSSLTYWLVLEPIGTISASWFGNDLEDRGQRAFSSDGGGTWISGTGNEILGAFRINAASSQVDADADGFPASEDCNDLDSSIYPGAQEISNGLDDDCDGVVDEGFTAEAVVYNNFAADGSFVGGSGYAVGGSGNFSAGMRFLPGQDGFLSSIEVGIRHNSGENAFTASIHLDQGGIPGTLLEMISVNGQAPPVKGIVSIAASGTTYLDSSLTYWLVLKPIGTISASWFGNDLEDRGQRAFSSDGGSTWISGTGNEILGAFRINVASSQVDADGDGFQAFSDCNDGDMSIYPGAPEVLNGVDDNCNGAVDEGIDNDGDGVFYPADCNDEDASIPGPEVLGDGIDNNCDGIIDEGDLDYDGVPDLIDNDPLDPNVCQDSDADSCDDCSLGFLDPNNDGPDFDSDGQCDAGDDDDDNDGVPDLMDSEPLDASGCQDTDADACDDCSSGVFNPSNDGPDLDGDGLCNEGDLDADNDGVPDLLDNDPFSPSVCQDVDGDTCDDCSVGVDAFGALADNDPNNDGSDFDADGQCNVGDDDDDNDGLPDNVDPDPLNPDIDGDGVLDGNDIAPHDFNPDQSDIDVDGIADVIDPCPSDPSNTCDQDASASESIDSSGGMLSTPDDSASISVPSGALVDDTSISVTDGGSGFVITSSVGEAVTVFAVNIGPEGTNFLVPITISFSWDDADNNGIVDGTSLAEPDLLVTKDGVAITNVCQLEPLCDQGANTFTFSVSSLSEFTVSGALDTDNDGIPDNFMGVSDACPTENSTGFDVDQDGCIDSVSGLAELVSSMVATEVIDSNMENSLISKLANVQKSQDKANICAMVNQLEAFQSQVVAQTGKKISAEAADMVTTYADSVITFVLSMLPPGEGC